MRNIAKNPLSCSKLSTTRKTVASSKAHFDITVKFRIDACIRLQEAQMFKKNYNWSQGHKGVLVCKSKELYGHSSPGCPVNVIPCC